jgi:glycosyltransferase involved in cell wall biosynthesis
MITPSYYPIKGGTETVVRNLSIALNKNNIQTDILTFNMDRKWNPKWRGKIEKTDGITVFKIPALNWLPIAHSPRITMGINLIPGRFTQILKQYDILHFHEDLTFPFFSIFVRKPKIFHLHGTVPVKAPHGIGKIERTIFKHIAHLYISLSRQDQKTLSTLGIPKNKITYLPNGVDTDLFSPQEKKEDNLLLFVGRIGPNKGLHILLESLSYLKKSIRLVIIGPADWNLEYYQNMLNLIESENRKKKHEIRYLGALAQADIIKWYQKASILILPSFEEGLPVTTLEALSCGTPVIATPVGGIPEVIKNHENGILIPQNDPFKLAETMQFLLENKDIRIKFGYEGRKLVVKDFSLKTAVSKLSGIYEQILNSFNP